MAIFTLLMAIAFMAISVDTGRLWLERRSVQRAADMAALAASRFTGCGASEADALAAAKTMAAEHGVDPGTVTIKFGVLTRDVNKAAVFTPAAIGSANLVRVALSRKVAKSMLLAGDSDLAGSIDVAGVGVAQGGPPVATYSVGSVFGISNEAAKQISNLYKGILGNGAPALDTAALNELVSATVTLGALQQAAGASTLNDFLQMQMTVREFLDFIAIANPDVLSLNSFMQLYNQAKTSSLKLTVGQILNIQSPPASGVSEAKISVFDLLNASLNVGALNQGGVINANLGLSFIGTTSISILSPPIIAIGPAGKNSSGNWCSSARSAQMSLKATITPGMIGNFNPGIADLALRVDLLSTVGHLNSLSVQPGDISGSITSQSTVLRLVLTRSADVNKDITNEANFRPGTLLLGAVGLKIYLPIGDAAEKNTSFAVANKSEFPSVNQLGAGSVGSSLGGLLGQGTNITVTVLFGLIKLPITFLDDLMRLVTIPLGNALDGLLAAFGVQTGSVRLQVLDVQTSPPVLRQ
jgi:uncharacterized membrane protein